MAKDIKGPRLAMSPHSVATCRVEIESDTAYDIAANHVSDLVEVV